MSWSKVPVLSGVSYTWNSGRNALTAFYSGLIFVPEGVDVPCPKCMVPHDNAAPVFCYDPWASSRVSNGIVFTPHEDSNRRYPIICAECHEQFKHGTDGVPRQGTLR
jgi:hypothetical protein